MNMFSNMKKNKTKNYWEKYYAKDIWNVKIRVI